MCNDRSAVTDTHHVQKVTYGRGQVHTKTIVQCGPVWNLSGTFHYDLIETESAMPVTGSNMGFFSNQRQITLTLV